MTLIAEILLAALVAWLIARRRPQWPRGKVALISALPVPMIIWALCIYIFVNAATASAEECGVDACGMAIAASMFMAAATFVVFLLGLLVAFLVVRNRPQLAEPDLASIFE